MSPAEKARDDGTHRGTTLLIRKNTKRAMPQGTNSAVPPLLNLCQIISRPCNVGRSVRNYCIHSGCSGRNFPRLCIRLAPTADSLICQSLRYFFPSSLLVDYVHFIPMENSLSSPLFSKNRQKQERPAPGEAFRNPRSRPVFLSPAGKRFPFTGSTEYRPHGLFFPYPLP